jgi:hypothetical protein
MRKFLLAAVGAMALIGGTATANAAALVISAGTTTIVSPPASGTFGNSFNPVALGLFTDTYTLNILASSLSNASLITIDMTGANNIDFACASCSVRLDSTAFTLVSTGPLDVFTLNPILLGAGLHTLTLTGNVTAGPTASYSGTMNFDVAPVPELATWAMMLVGFGGIGMAVRRRQRSSGALIQAA